MIYYHIVHSHADKQPPQAAHWVEARSRERDQLRRYGVYTITPFSSIPKDTRIVDTRWVWIKRKLDGSIEKYKARKVGRGFTQEDGINYDSDKTYAQMMRPETFKISLIIALHNNWAIRQWDVVAVYLQAYLHHDVYISNINEQGQTEYWKLGKALYGLEQAGHELFKTLEHILSLGGLRQCIGDEGTYVNRGGSLIIGTHVDDLVGIAPTEALLDQIEQEAEKAVELEKRGKPIKLLGIELTWSEEGSQVTMTQQALIDSMVTTHLQGNIYPRTSLPLNPSLYEEGTDDKLPDAKPYQALVGGLLYIARMTRPEISIQVNLLGRRTASPSAANLKAARDTPSYHQMSRHYTEKTPTPGTHYICGCLLRRGRG